MKKALIKTLAVLYGVFYLPLVFISSVVGCLLSIIALFVAPLWHILLGHQNILDRSATTSMSAFYLGFALMLKIEEIINPAYD